MDDPQIIKFDESSILINSRNVLIQPRALDSMKGINEIRETRSIIDRLWGERMEIGRLIASHSKTHFVAKVYEHIKKKEFALEINYKRISMIFLIEQNDFELKDIAFSSSDIPYLASIDVYGNVKIYKLSKIRTVLKCRLIINMKADPPFEVPNNRIMWCSPKTTNSRSVEESVAAGTNNTLLLGVVHGSTFELLQIDRIINELSALPEGSLYEIDRVGLREITRSFQEQFSDIYSLDRGWTDVFLPYLEYTAAGDNSIIISLTINSDATALAVASCDGAVRLFTLNSRNPAGLNFERCLTPFTGGAIGSILFLDDCREDSNINSFGRYFVVGSAFNRQIKVFRFGTLGCIQTVSFEPLLSPSLLSAHQSGRNLIMTEIGGKVFYILRFDPIENNERKLFTNVQRFVLNEAISSIDFSTINSATDISEEEQTEEEDNTTDLEHDSSTVYLNESGTINSATDISEEEQTEEEDNTTDFEHLLPSGVDLDGSGS